MKHTAKLLNATESDLYAISLKSAEAKSKQVYICEISEMSNLFDKPKAEELRSQFLKNGVKVKQITNSSSFPKFTENEEFVNTVMAFRYIPSELFAIKKEVLIFDDTVAIYNKSQLLIIEDAEYAQSQKQLFNLVWDQGHSPKLGFEYKPNHSFYNSIDIHIDNLQVIVWPDAEAKLAWGDLTQNGLSQYIEQIIQKDEYYKDASYLIAFIWSHEGQKMIDIWKFNQNYIDDRSGPLGDIRVYKDGALSNDLGIASGNTLLVLGFEEKLRRQSKDLKSYLQGATPVLPLEVMNGLSFF